MKSISRTIRVVIKDISPLIHEQMPANLRSVSIRLTEEQARELRLRHEHEDVAYVFFDEDQT